MVALSQPGYSVEKDPGLILIVFYQPMLNILKAYYLIIMIVQRFRSTEDVKMCYTNKR